MSVQPTFPPLLQGEATEGDPFEQAQAMAVLGCDAGTVVYNVQADALRAAFVLTPEQPLEQAIAMLPLCEVGLQNALGALAPPEVAVNFTWQGGILVNGASCGSFRAVSASNDPKETPEWLIIGVQLPLLMTGEAPGHTPDITALYNEGCADVDATLLLESWARHCLNWIHRWESDGTASLHAEWMGLVTGVGDNVVMGDFEGTFLGVDEHFGMLIRDGSSTHLVPMTKLVEQS